MKSFRLGVISFWNHLIVLIVIWAIVLVFRPPVGYSEVYRGQPGPPMIFRQASQRVGPYQPLTIVSAQPIRSGRMLVHGMQGETIVQGHTLTYYPKQRYPFNEYLELKAEVELENGTLLAAEYTLVTADYSTSLWVEVAEAEEPQVVRIWQGERLLRTMVCSAGKAASPTPEGVFRLQDRGYSFWSTKYQEGAYYWVRLRGNYLFHSIPFGKDLQIKAGERERLGTPASHGCIRLDLPDARWFYENMPTGTYVIIRKGHNVTTPTWWQQQNGKILTVAMATDVVRLDPHDTSDNPSAIVNLHIYDTLFELTPTGELIPALAIAATPQADGLIWEVQLRNDVFFQDGTHLTAREVCTSFTRLLNSEKKLARRGFFAAYITKVEPRDKYRLVFRLTQPIATFPFLLAHTSAAIVRESPLDGTVALYGTGPYRLQRWDPGYQVILSRSKYPWGNPKLFEQIIFKVVPEGSSRAVMLEAGMVDAAFPLSPLEAARLQEVGGVQVLSHPSQRVIYIGFNLKKAVFADPLLRQAFNYAVDKDAIISTLLNGLGEKIGSGLAPTVSGFVPITPYPYDPGKARKLLAQVAKPTGPIQLWAPQDRYLQDAKVAEAIAGYLEDIGIEVELQLWEWSTYMSALNRDRADWDLFLLGWVPATGEAYLGLAPLFMADSRSNLTFYADPAIESLLQEALGCANPYKRQIIYSQIQQALHQQAPWIFLYAQDQTVGLRHNLTGVEIFPTEVISFRQARRES